MSGIGLYGSFGGGGFDEKFNAALANKLKTQDANAASTATSADASMMNAQTQQGMAPSAIALRQAQGNASMMDAVTNRANLGLSSERMLTPHQVSAYGLSGSGMFGTPQNLQQGLRTPQPTLPGMSVTPLAPAAQPAGLATDPKKNGGYLQNYARGGPIGDVEDDTGRDTRKVMARPGEYFLNPETITHGFGGGNYDHGVRNLDEIVRRSTGQEPGPTYSKKGKAGFARSGMPPARKKSAPLLPEASDMSDEDWNNYVAKVRTGPGGYPMHAPAAPSDFDARDLRVRQMGPGRFIPGDNRFDIPARGSDGMGPYDSSGDFEGSDKMNARLQPQPGVNRLPLPAPMPGMPVAQTKVTPGNPFLALPDTNVRDQMLARQARATTSQPPSEIARDAHAAAALPPPPQGQMGPEAIVPQHFGPESKWGLRDAIAAGGKPGTQVTADYGVNYGMGPGVPRIIATANKAGRFNDFSDVGLRMAKGGKVPGFQFSGANLHPPAFDEFGATNAAYEFPEVRTPAQAAQEAAVTEENIRNAQAAARGARSAPMTPPEPLPPGRIAQIRSAISGPNATAIRAPTLEGVKEMIKSVGPKVGGVARGVGIGAAIEAGGRGAYGAATTSPEDYATRFGTTPGEGGGSFTGAMKDMGLRTAGALTDIGAAGINALMAPANFMRYGTDTSKWSDYRDEFKDVADQKAWQDRIATIKARHPQGSEFGKAADHPTAEELLAGAAEQRDKAMAAAKAAPANAAAAQEKSFRDQLVKQYWDLENDTNPYSGMGGKALGDKQRRILSYLGQVDPQVMSAQATARHQQAQAGAAHEKDMAEHINKSFVRPKMKDGKPTGESEEDPETRNIFLADAAARGWDPYNWSRAQYEQVRKDWDYKHGPDAALRGAFEASGHPGRYAASARGMPIGLRGKPIGFDDWLDPRSTTGFGDVASSWWNQAKGSMGDPMATRMAVQEYIDPVTGKKAYQSAPANKALVTPGGAMNLDALRIIPGQDR